ncbi:serine hydrolase [Paralcaligenes sp. KSB-10]|uniref:serine hydrolase n=1 Tax=Paralcaligenes sp. KSB-10 TaxID=2901142 RepID=UPI001E38D2B9|nr:serine hydrolase [Paralcaligenes sp. KSB-10]UHL66122.1 serine hydrolase [Paralcaligenes sp. KSB-10]
MHVAAIKDLARMLRLSALTVALTVAAPVLAHQTLVDVGKTPGQDVVAMADKGLDKAIAALPEIVASILKRSGVPGAAVAVVHGGKTIFAQGFGVRQLGKPTPVDPGTVFQIASVSKSLTASVIAVEVSKGVVAWDDPVARYLPDFKLSDPYVAKHATIGDFMAHRTGLPFAAGDELEDLGYDRTQIIQRLSHLPLDPFRASYHYANFGTTIAAEAVAVAAGKKWEDLAAQALFKPLGMTSTSSRHADYLARDDRAVLHALEGGKFQPLFDRNPDEQSPAGGVSSTVLDLAKWLEFLLANGQHDGRQLATPDALRAAMSPHSFSAPAHSLDARPGFYGYGFNTGINANGRTSFSHSGAFLLGAATSYLIIPSADIGIVVLTNGSPVGAAESIGMQFMDIVQYGEPLRDWYAAYNGLMRPFFNPVGDLAGKRPPAQAQAPGALESYTGHYKNAYFGAADIKIDKQQLVLTLGPRHERIVMAHWDGDTFAVAPRSENAPEGSRSSVRFLMKDGKARGFTIEYLNQNGMATWRR